jgi:flagellar motor protein MotB
MRTHSLALLAVAALLLPSCGRPPRPAALADANQVRQAPAVAQAAEFAPQQLAHGDAIRKQAEEAYEQGNIAKAGILAERAVVAYERAAVLARLARAELLAAEAELAIEKTSQEQRALDAERERLEADIASIEQLIRVVKDAQPLTPTPAADHSREMARLTAARSIIVDARLLCSAARLLGQPLEGLERAQAEVLRLEQLLPQWPKPAPIDETLRARAQCLSLLTLARRSQSVSTPADMVLMELSQVPDLNPVRDDRGLVVVLRGDVHRDPAVKARIDAIAAVANKHAQFPVQVVAHTRAKPPPATQNLARERSQAVSRALEAAGIDKSRIEVLDAGPHRPIVHDPLPPPQNSKNDRIEVVLVAPAS